MGLNLLSHCVINFSFSNYKHDRGVTETIPAESLICAIVNVIVNTVYSENFAHVLFSLIWLSELRANLKLG